MTLKIDRDADGDLWTLLNARCTVPEGSAVDWLEVADGLEAWRPGSLRGGRRCRVEISHDFGRAYLYSPRNRVSPDDCETVSMDDGRALAAQIRAAIAAVTIATPKRDASHAAVLFLDIDGVLNGHDFDELAQSSSIRTACVARLNRVLAATACDVVISSAWRYMVLNGAMTLSGFGYLLRTHSVRLNAPLLGTTGRDTQTEDPAERGRQVQAWLAEHPDVTRYAVVDDMALGFAGMPFVRTDGTKGLTDEDAERLIGLLMART